MKIMRIRRYYYKYILIGGGLIFVSIFAIVKFCPADIKTESSIRTIQIETGYISNFANDPRVQQLQAAYPYEILLAADIAHNNALNSYQSFHPIQVNAQTSSTLGATSMAITSSRFESPITTSTISSTVP